MGALKRSAQYWAKRFDQLTDAQLNKGADFYRNIAEQYEKAAAAVQKDIESWYMRFARNQAITLTEAKRLLNTRELKEFKWTVEEYIEKGETLNYSKAWAKQLENASARFHVSRLEALQLQMQQQAELLYGYELDGLDTLARKIYTEGYYHTAHIIQTGVGVGWDFMRLNTNLIDKVISKPWAADGADFSARLWKSRSQLVATLNDSLVQSIIRGQSPAQTIDLIRGKFKTSRAQAGRLVMTESAYFSAAAQRDSFRALDVERYQIVATLDRLTSEICRSLDGKVLPMSEYSPGSTAPPFHPYCRTTTVPYFEDDIGERAARDDEGKYYTVPSNMTYKEWEKTILNTEVLTNPAKGDISTVVNGTNLAGKWKRRPAEFDHEINDIINAQGFDGPPREVKKDEFDKLVQDDHFIAQRTYSAKTKEELAQYAQELRSGPWYIDCSVGGAQYGQGMYVAADYTKGSNLAGITSEMKHYTQLGKNRGFPFHKTETITLDKSARIYTPIGTKVTRLDLMKQVAAEYINENPTLFGLTEQYVKAYNTVPDAERKALDATYFKEWKKLYNMIFRRKRDIGAMLAELGYDAINAVGHGTSGSYTVILNRTKVILLED